MVTACKNYLTDRGVNRVWDQPRQPLIEKLKACLRLNQEYQKCFQRTKRRIAEDPTMKPFEFSEMYIFGKFDTFCKRLNQVRITYLKSFAKYLSHNYRLPSLLTYCPNLGTFLEGPENVSHPDSRSKISNLMITELFYSRILKMNRGSLHKRSFRRMYCSVFCQQIN